jgi:hypothetical protein
MIQLKAEAFACLNGTIEGLRCALQTAIELEHSTIPPYLYALYSLKPGTNGEIGRLLLSVIQQEMLHMALDCNILNAINGCPDIDKPHFIPKYPGPLPGSVESGLIVPLAPFSKQLVQDVFMVIEEPEDPLHFPVLRATAEAAPSETIGQFYAGIKDQIRKLGADHNIFTGPPEKQLTTGFKPLQVLRVSDEASALAAIDLIVDQGEGTRKSPLDVEDQPAHYYRFAEVFYGRKLIRNPDPKPREAEFAYAGHRIRFDPSGVWPTLVNPKRSDYEAGSKARNLNDTFNYTYTKLLQWLHLVFNGQPDRLGPAMLLMQALREQAMLLMSFDLVPGMTGGPSFEYNPVNPLQRSLEAA